MPIVTKMVVENLLRSLIDHGLCQPFFFTLTLPEVLLSIWPRTRRDERVSGKRDDKRMSEMMKMTRKREAGNHLLQATYGVKNCYKLWANGINDDHLSCSANKWCQWWPLRMVWPWHEQTRLSHVHIRIRIRMYFINTNQETDKYVRHRGWS